MPIPVSETWNATTEAAVPRIGWSSLQPPAATDTDRLTPPCSVNLNALDNRFFSTCCRRFESVTRLRVRCWIGVYLKAEPPVLRLVPERTSDHIEQAGEEHLFGIH